MTLYTYYFCRLSCGHTIRWSDFKPLPPRLCSKTWCPECNDEAIIKEIEGHTDEVEDVEEMA